MHLPIAPSLRLAVPASVAACLLLGGCAHGPQMRAALTPPPEPTINVRSQLPIYDGGSGAAADWAAILNAARDADIIVIGELHDDAVGHRVQRALYTDILAAQPGTALSMEMLDRSEQEIVDDYLAGLIDRETFIERTASTKWRRIARQYIEGELEPDDFARQIMKPGWPEWETNYQPIIDVAKDAGAPVVAANAPWLVYTQLIDETGYDPLAALSAAQQAMFTTPTAIPQGRYNERFREFMSSGHGMAPGPSEVTDAAFLESFRTQLLYDSTMGASIARALDHGAPKVVHLVGGFHSDYEGGTVIEAKARGPGARVLTISMQQASVDVMREVDRNRADFIIYTLPASQR